ncbi:hypothetical protein CYLTODRAFT_415358 [Cylindrobasidium torrendii FP15055 ss-10]|uniref:NAD(P)-binding protein n=1 Tax=Cylindrobasidium torrendii FP15055 ss-10 TaxID=1314674 RepID=A0A0D7AU71_9AGAR|nr:hypothetical protein CYLTODRAFT_415358 [Cylindrobasidium torrendii FP15055 ss-10]
MVPYTPDVIWAGQKRAPPPPLVTGYLTGKTIIIIVTGTNVGLGFKACKHFATMNHKKIFPACGNSHKGTAALKDLTCPGAEVWPLDLSSFKSLVIQFADRAETARELDRLNASMVNWGRHELAVDLSRFSTHAQSRLDPEAPLVVTSVCPGLCMSNLRSVIPDSVKDSIKKIEDEMAYTTEEGSRQLVFAAVGGENDALKGQFIQKSETKEICDWALGEEGAAWERKAWTDALDVLAGVDKRVTKATTDIFLND